jgi:hypothetical protein
MNGMIIDHLPNRPRHVETVARWIYAAYYQKRNWKWVCKIHDGKGIETEVYQFDLI